MNGKDSYPPNYAEFIGMCCRSGETQCHKPFQRDRALEDKGAKERAQKAGEEHIGIMKGLFR
jgi:hypothetical protein